MHVGRNESRRQLDARAAYERAFAMESEAKGSLVYSAIPFLYTREFNEARRRLESEDRDRLVCDSCQFILYENPKVVAGVLPITSGGIVLLRRGIQPRIGTTPQTAPAAAVSTMPSTCRRWNAPSWVLWF